MSDFSRTLQTASDAEGTAKMLRRIAEGRGTIHRLDVQRLEALAQRYTEYAAALRETVVEDPAPELDQPALI
jgi:hypothetical protein